MEICKELISKIFDQAVVNPRLRQYLDLRTSPDDGSQRMLNALMPGTVIPIHRHPQSNETVILLCGKLVEIIYDGCGNEIERHHLDPEVGSFGYVVPKCVWHSVEVLEPSVIFEAKDGKFGLDGSETLQEYNDKKSDTNMITEDLKKRVAEFIEMEQRSCSMDVMTPEYVARCMQISLEDAAEALKALKK